MCSLTDTLNVTGGKAQMSADTVFGALRGNDAVVKECASLIAYHGVIL